MAGGVLTPTNLRLPDDYPQLGQVNRLNPSAQRVYDQPLLPGQTTVTGEGAVTRVLDLRSNSDLRSL
jgi:hypothetical protein